MTEHFAVRGVVEGFYGVFYTPPERESLLRFLADHGFNLYIYGPKNDRFHRARWRLPYPEDLLQELARAADLGRERDVEFCYAISPGTDIRYSDDDDFDAITRKLGSFHERGIRSFSLFLDDIASTFRHAADGERYGTYAEAHADLTNRLRAWLLQLDPACRLSMCPTRYHGEPPFSPYIQELGERLHPEIEVFYTGVDVCSATIGPDETRAFGEAMQRAPLIWDNYPVNDLAMQPQLHIGPVRGRSHELTATVKGFAVNPMIQAEASKIPLATFAAYFRDPAGYDPDRAWDEALVTVAGEDSAGALRSLAETSLRSPLRTPEAERLQRLTDAALEELRAAGNTGGTALDAFTAYLDELDEACDHLKFRMRNLALRNELLPWIEALEHWLWSARFALEVLDASHAGEDLKRPLARAQERLATAKAHPKWIGGRAFLPLIEHVLGTVQEPTTA